MKPEAYLFDLDDTILTDNAVSETCWREACQEWALSNHQVSPDDLASSIQEARNLFLSDPIKSRWLSLNLPKSRTQVVLMAFESLGIEMPGSAEPLALRFDAIKKAEIGFFPGAIKTLRHLRGQGQKMGLVTNGSELLQREKIERFSLEPLFDCIVIEGAFGAGKPDRRVFDFALDTLKVEVEAAVRLGLNNHPSDHWAAKIPFMDAAAQVLTAHTGSPGPLDWSVPNTMTPPASLIWRRFSCATGVMTFIQVVQLRAAYWSRITVLRF